MRLTGFKLFVLVKRLVGRLRDGRTGLLRRFGASPAPPQDLVAREIPRILWIFWAEGEAAAPDVVRFCIESWRDKNPGWTVRVLDRGAAEAVVTMPALPSSISVAHYADVLRVRLLAAHGGVWADATCYCARPLDAWLPTVARSGFFCFAWSGADGAYLRVGPRRIMGNWFLASERQGGMILALEQATLAYWRGRARADTYYWQHFLFEWLLLTDRAFRNGWSRTPRLGAMPVHYVFHWLRTGCDEDLARRAAASEATPLHKLTWKGDVDMSRLRALLP